jgi:hypothetical protein
MTTSGRLGFRAVTWSNQWKATALAAHWAHQVAQRFPDGQPHVNLRGYDAAQQVTAADALAGFLQTRGMPGQDIPPEADERAGLYRACWPGSGCCWHWITLDRWSRSGSCNPLPLGCVAVVTGRDPNHWPGCGTRPGGWTWTSCP